MILIDEDKILKVISKRKPSSVSLNGPESLFPKIQETAKKIMEIYSIPAYVIGDTCWASCDLNTHAADILGADLLFNIGHTVSLEMFGNKVIIINAYDDIEFDVVAKKFASDVDNQKIRSIGLVTDSQHLEQIESVRKIFQQSGLNVIIGQGKGELNNTQVFGCEFYPAYDVKNQIDAYIFLGQSMFHSASIAMSTEKPTFMLDPYFDEYSQVNEFAHGLQKRAILSIYKALDAERIGIIIGLKEGQFAHIRALELKK